MRAPLSRLIQRRPAVVRAMSVALIVATWRGPLPCIHVHTDQTEQAPPALAAHVRACHTAEHSGDGTAWHLHWMVLPNILRLSVPSAPEDIPDDPLLAQRSVVDLSTGATAIGLLRAASLHAGGAADVTLAAALGPGAAATGGCDSSATQAGASFATTLLTSAPLCAVTGVALC